MNHADCGGVGMVERYVKRPVSAARERGVDSCVSIDFTYCKFLFLYQYSPG